MEKAARRVSQAFVQGLAWSLAYYTRGPAQPAAAAPRGAADRASWEWCARRSGPGAVRVAALSARQSRSTNAPAVARAG